MQHSHTLHKSSDFLADRHPYKDEASAACFVSSPDPSEVTQAFGQREIPKLASLLVHDNLSPKDRISALKMLIGTSINQERKYEAVSKGVIESSTSLCRDENSEVRAHAALVIARHASALQGRNALREAAGVNALTGNLVDTDNEARECASEALSIISGFSDAQDMFTNDEDIIKSLVSSCGREKHIPILLNVVTTLVHITQYHEGITKTLAAGSMPKLVRILTSGEDSSELTAATQQAIGNLSISADGKSHAIKEDAVAQIAAHLLEKDTEVRRTGAEALMAIAVNEDGKIAIMKSAIPALCQLVLEASEEAGKTRANCIIAINHASENKAAKLLFVKTLMKNLHLLLDVIGIEAAKECNDLLTDPDVAVQRDAAKAIKGICQEDQGLKQVMDWCLYPVERLAYLLTSDDRETVLHAVGGLCNLASENENAAKRLTIYLADKKHAISMPAFRDGPLQNWLPPKPANDEPTLL